MARVKRNIVTQGLSGMLGNSLVFRQRGDQTIVSAAPIRDREPSPSQTAARTRFLQGVQYAKGQLQYPASRSAYQAVVNDRVTSAYIAAMRDFLQVPEVQAVDASGYDGSIGSQLRITAFDDFEAAAVSVRIERATGTFVEAGNAVQQTNGNEWLYTATSTNGTPAGSRIIVTAVDRPGNTREATFTI